MLTVETLEFWKFGFDNYHYGKLTFQLLAVCQSSDVLILSSDQVLTLEMSALQIFHGGNSTFTNSFD